MAEVVNDSVGRKATIAVPDSLSKVDNEVTINGHEDGSDNEEAPKDSINISLPVADRIKRKAKRPSKFAAKDLSRAKSDTQIVAPLRALKNSRKSRNGFGRGLPKKGG